MNVSEKKLLCEALGDAVGKIHRTYFHDGRDVDTSEGELTLVFRSGRVLRFADTPHGYGLSVHATRYANPFQQPASELAPEDAMDRGRYQEVDVSTQDEWRHFVGQRLMAVAELVYRPHGEAAGISLRFAQGSTLYVSNLADEVIVRQVLDEGDFVEHLVCDDTASGTPSSE